MATDPSMVIFNTRKSLESLPLDKDLILSWRDGPVKEKSFTRRGRPRKTNQLSSGKCKPTTQRSSTNKPVYEFVSWTDSSGNTDAAARKAVRSHTMRHCKPRQYESNSPPRVHHSPDSLFENHPGTLENEFKIYMATMPHEISTLDPFDCLPIRMRPYMLELFNKYTTCVYEKAFSIETCLNYNPMKDYILPLAFRDLALFHVILFSSICLKTISPGSKELPRALMHLRECIRLVNERLTSLSPMLYDSTFLVVATLAYFEKLNRQHKNWEVHMRGLRQMVLLRGGLETFRSNRVLYNMILRTDLCGSIDAERKPFFDDIGVPAVMTQIQCTYTSEGFYEINSLAPFSDEFIQILRRIENSTDALNVLRGGSTLTPLDLRDELTSIQYALLRIESSRHDLNESKVQHICRQGLLLYSATILNGLPSTASNFDMLGANLVVALQDTFGENRITQGLRLWLALLITTIVCDETSKSWARREFATIFQSSFAHKQEHAKAQLERFFWVDRIHGPRLDELWKKALGNSESQSVRAVKRSKEKCDDAFSLSL